MDMIPHLALRRNNKAPRLEKPGGVLWFYLLGDISSRGTNLFLQGDGSAGNQSNNSQSSSYANNIVSAGAGVGGGAGGGDNIGCGHGLVGQNNSASDLSSSSQNAILIELSAQIGQSAIGIDHVEGSTFALLVNSDLYCLVGNYSTAENAGNGNIVGDDLALQGLGQLGQFISRNCAEDNLFAGLQVINSFGTVECISGSIVLGSVSANLFLFNSVKSIASGGFGYTDNKVSSEAAIVEHHVEDARPVKILVNESQVVFGRILELGNGAQRIILTARKGISIDGIAISIFINEPVSGGASNAIFGNSNLGNDEISSIIQGNSLIGLGGDDILIIAFNGLYPTLRGNEVSALSKSNFDFILFGSKGAIFVSGIASSQAQIIERENDGLAGSDGT